MKKWIFLLFFFSIQLIAEEDFYCSALSPSCNIFLYNNTGCPASYFLSIGYGNIGALGSPSPIFSGEKDEWLIYPKILNTCPEGTLRVDYVLGGRYLCSFYTTVECVSREKRTFKIVSTSSTCARPIKCSIEMYTDSAVFKVY